MGYRLNCLESVFISVSNLLLTEFGIHHRLESCEGESSSNRLLCISYFYDHFEKLAIVFESISKGDECGGR